jgi:uncharacterized membrane protein YdfJ with MMPL/SSD domain
VAVELRALSRTSVRRRRPLLAFWLAVLLVGVVISVRGPGLHANALTVPGSESARAQSLLEREFGREPRSSFTIVFTGVVEADEAALRRLLRDVRRRLGAAEVSRLTRVDGLAHAQLESGVDPEAAKALTPAVRAALGEHARPRALVTGWPALEHDLEQTLRDDLRRGEAVAIPLAIVALALVFGISPALLLPLAAAATTGAATLALLTLVARAVPIPSVAANLVWLIGIALAIDYSLFYLYRFREELRRGFGEAEALERAGTRAGRAVLFSGVAVAAGLGLLALIPVPFVAALGFTGMLVGLVSAAVSLTLLPALGSLLGERGLQPLRLSTLRRGRRGKSSSDPVGTGTGGEGGAWARVARLAMLRPFAVAFACTAVLVAAAAPVARMELGPGSLARLPDALESIAAARTLAQEAGAGALLPNLVVVDSGRDGGARARAFADATERLTELLLEDPEPLLVASGADPPWTDPAGRYALVVVGGASAHHEPAARAFVSRLREQHLRAARYPPGSETAVGGAPAQAADFLSRSYGSLPWVLLALGATSFLLLVRALRSLVLPVKALLLNAVSVAAACGVLVAVFDWGWGAGVLGIEPTGTIEAWVPIFLFAALFGLSLDYELFLVLRMREHWEESHDNERAVALGLERSGRVVSAAALVMVCAFSGFLVGDVPALQQLGVGLVAGVLIDVTLVRALLLPALMALLGRYNWWLPSSLARLAGAPASPLVARESDVQPPPSPTAPVVVRSGRAPDDDAST